MKDQLLKEIAPIVEKFVDDTISKIDGIGSLKKGLVQKNREFEDLIEKQKQLLEEAKKTKSDAKKVIDKKITELESAKEDFKSKYSEYDKLVRDRQSKVLEIDKKLQQVSNEHLAAKDATDEAEKLKAIVEKKALTLKNKLDYLQEDDEKAEIRNDDFNERERRLKTRENRCDSRETAQEVKSAELSARENALTKKAEELKVLERVYK